MATENVTIIQRRNAVVLGKTGSGKSTIANMIAGCGNFKLGKMSQSATSKVSQTQVQFRKPGSKIQYDIKIIDTIGLFDTNQSAVKRNEAILREIKNYFQQKVAEGVSLVIFAFRQGRFTKEEKDTFEFIIKNFRAEISEISSLVITHCENEDEGGRNLIIDDFKTNARDIASFMTKGIYAVGFPDTTNMKPRLKTAFEEDVKKDTEKLRQIVFNSGEMRLAKEIFQQTFWDRILLCNIL